MPSLPGPPSPRIPRSSRRSRRYPEPALTAAVLPGETTANIGTINGGLALNVIPPQAEAGLLIRMTTKREPIEKALEAIVRGRAEIEVLSCSEPVKLHE